MAKRLKVLSPITSDGKMLRYDENSQVAYRESILMPAAELELKRMNAKLPKHLHHKFEIIEVEEENPGLSNAELKARLADLEKADEKDSLQKRIAELEAKLAKKDSKISEKSPVVDNGSEEEIEEIPPTIVEKTVKAPVKTGGKSKTKSE